MNIFKTILLFLLGFATILINLSSCPPSVDSGPQAEFQSDVTSGTSPLTVQFTDLSIPGDSPINEWSWLFGDGSSSTQQHPTHIYLNAGTYDVSLTVTTNNGEDTELKFNFIYVMVDTSEEGEIEGEDTPDGELGEEGEDEDADRDNDGLPDSVEAIVGSSIDTPDSDMDGINDADEVYNYLTNPISPDTDKDGICDADEIASGKDPLLDETATEIFQSTQGVINALRRQLKSLLELQTSESILIRAMEFAQLQPNVKDAVISDDSRTLRVEFTNGLKFLVNTEQGSNQLIQKSSSHGYREDKGENTVKNETIPAELPSKPILILDLDLRNKAEPIVEKMFTSCGYPKSMSICIPMLI